MPKIIFDIETAGEDYEKMDTATQEFIQKRIKNKTENKEDFESELEKYKDELVFSPLTAEIVAVGVLDTETEKGAVYHQDLNKDVEEFEKDDIKFKPMNEKELLKSFWKVCAKAEEFISFNGRGFDVPFLMIRSAIHKIRPSKNLLANRYMNLQPQGAKHVDLMDQLNFYGAVWGKTNLHLSCRAFGIKSPKEEGIDGEDVTRLFREGKYKDIARYNARDLRATKSLFEYWDKYLRY